MSRMDIETWTRRLYTYKVYPRAHYFRKRLLNLYPRFRRVIDTFPDSLQDPVLLELIEQCAHTFANPAQIVFLGNGALDVGGMVVDGAQLGTDDDWDHDNRYPTLTIQVCYITVEDDGKTSQQITDSVLKALFKSETYQECVSNRLFIRVNIRHTLKQSQLESFIKFIHSSISNHATLCANRDCLSINNNRDKDESTFGEVISECLEIEMIKDFEIIRSYLLRFVCTANNITIERRIIDEVNTMLRAFVVDFCALEDALQLSSNEDSADTSEHVRQPADVLLECIYVKLKCLMIPLLSRTYGLGESLTTALLEKMQFIHRIPENVTHNTRLCVAQMYDLDLKPKMLNQRFVGSKTWNRHCQETDRLMTSLMSNLSPVITDAEAAASTARTSVTTVKKMINEVDGCKDISKIGTTCPTARVPVLTEELRHSLSRIPGVYGHGMLYGKLEVHVTRSNAEVNNAIAATLREHNFHLAYNVELVNSQPESFGCRAYEPNMSIGTQTYDGKWTSGTLGGYITDRERKEIYAITCAHIVSKPDAGEQEVFIQEGGKHVRLGCSTPQLCLYNDPFPVDFAAVKVDAELTDHCVLRWHDENWCLQRGQLADGQLGSEAMRFPFVYKHGAASGLTYGTVVDSDYRVGKDVSVMLIQTLPGDDKPFAISGDSGAVVCAPFVDTVDMVHTVSMVIGGDIKLYGDAESTVITSPLSKCMHELHKKSAIDFILP